MKQINYILKLIDFQACNFSVKPYGWETGI